MGHGRKSGTWIRMSRGVPSTGFVCVIYSTILLVNVVLLSRLYRDSMRSG